MWQTLSMLSPRLRPATPGCSVRRPYVRRLRKSSTYRQMPRPNSCTELPWLADATPGAGETRLPVHRMAVQRAHDREAIAPNGARSVCAIRNDGNSAPQSPPRTMGGHSLHSRSFCGTQAAYPSVHARDGRGSVSGRQAICDTIHRSPPSDWRRALETFFGPP